MKKLAIVIVVLVLAGLGLSACKSHEKCPAYSSIHRDKHETYRY